MGVGVCSVATPSYSKPRTLEALEPRLNSCAANFRRSGAGCRASPPAHYFYSMEHQPKLGGTLSLASARELKAHLQAGGKPLLVEACHGKDAKEGSLPGAVVVHLEDLDDCSLNSEGAPVRKRGTFSLLPFDVIRGVLERHGIVHDRQIVVFTQSQRAGGVDVNVAARLAWCLLLCGVGHVTLLADGVEGWQREGGKLEAPAQPTPVDDFYNGKKLDFPLHPEWLAGTDEVAAAVAAGRGEDVGSKGGDGGEDGRGDVCARGAAEQQPAEVDTQLADVRSRREYDGGPHDYDFPLARGRIKESIFLDWGKSTYVGGGLHKYPSAALHPLAAVREAWEEAGLRLSGGGDRGGGGGASGGGGGGGGGCSNGGDQTTAAVGSGSSSSATTTTSSTTTTTTTTTTTPYTAPSRIIFYCGSGWRSALAWCLCRLVGHDDCANFDGGILEWSWVEGRPLVVGEVRE